MKKLWFTAALSALVAFAPSQSEAQLPKGYTDIGVVAGLGNIGDAGIAPGFRFERIIKDLPDLGGGTLGIGVGVGYYSWSDRFLGSSWDVSYMPIGATGNYHFKLSNKKLDAFLGLGLGYQVINCDYSGAGGSVDLCDNSAVYFIGRAGGRYFFKPNMSAYADLGAGDATINVGVTFKLK
ncbi:MAG: hypothetical protein IBJ03_08875 [Gemmatimonadaceae bacterium]|nr:hypothetical protein [Gemmatimonadaceae bacterium]